MAVEKATHGEVVKMVPQTVKVLTFVPTGENIRSV